jgi:hypothetical protein
VHGDGRRLKLSDGVGRSDVVEGRHVGDPVGRRHRQDRGLAIIERAIRATTARVRAVVRFQVTMNDEMVLPVVVQIVDVFRRAHREPTNRHRSESPDAPPDQHTGMLRQTNRRHN